MVASALLPRKKRPSRRKTSLRSPVDRRAIVGEYLIEAVGVRETVETEYSVSGLKSPRPAADSADGFTKGWIRGAAAHEKIGSTTLAQQDRDDPLPRYLLP